MPDNKGKKYKKNKVYPRVLMFKQFYLDSSSETFCNITKSAVKAGYSWDYADNITALNPKWWTEFQEEAEYRRARLLDSSEKVLESYVNIDDNDDKDRMKIKVDTAKFVSERIGKDHYSTRKELTDKGGKRLFNETHTNDSQVALEDLFVNYNDS